jgi:hypothetical protein
LKPGLLTFGGAFTVIPFLPGCGAIGAVLQLPVL